MVKRFGHAFATEAVEAPKQHHIEAPLVSIDRELLELRPLTAAPALLVAVLLIAGCSQAARQKCAARAADFRWFGFCIWLSHERRVR